MPNANVTNRLVGAGSPAQGSLAVPAIVVSTAATTIFTNQLGGAAVLNPVPGGALSGASSAPSYGANMDGFVFKVRACGKYTTGGSTNLTFIIQNGTSTTSGSNTTIANTGSALACNTVSGCWFIEATCIWDSVLQKIIGVQSSALIGSAGTQQVQSAVALTNVANPTTQAALQFVCGVTASGSVSVTATLDEFVLETV